MKQVIHRILILIAAIGCAVGIYLVFPPKVWEPMPDIPMPQARADATQAVASQLKVESRMRTRLTEMNPEVYIAAADELESKESKTEAVSIVQKGLNRYQGNEALEARLDKLRPRVRASLGSGTYNGRQTVTLSADQGSVIYYAYGGGEPTKSYSGGIYLGYGTTKLRAVARYPELDGDAIEMTYTVLPAPPILPQYNSSTGDMMTIFINQNDSSLTIYYNVDGGAPTVYDTEYDPRIGIEIYGSSTINAISVTEDGMVSQVVSQRYEILDVPDEYQSMVSWVRPANRDKLLTLIAENPDIMTYYQAVQEGLLTDKDLVEKAETYRSVGMQVFYLPSSNTVKAFH